MKLTFKVKLLLLCFSISCVSIVVGGIGFYGIQNVSKKYDAIALDALPKIHLADQMFLEYRRVRIALRTLGLPGLSTEEAEKSITGALDAIEKYEIYEKEYTSMLWSPGQRELYDKLEVSWKDFKATGAKVIALYKSGKPDDLAKMTNIFFHECPEKAKAYTVAVEALTEFHQVEVKKDVAAAESASNFATALSLLTIVLGFVLSITTAYIFSSSISRSIQKIIEKLNENVAEVTIASSDIAGASQELSQATTQQAASLQQTAASLEQINAMISRASENANITSSTSAQSQQKAEGGRSAVEEMTRSMNEINSSNEAIMNQINNSNQQMTEIVQVIQEIGAKTTVINDIVFQTKLLSFNASVEAARAGEHGKGFAVVAEEVGNLAQMSGNAAKEISDMLAQSISKVDQIVNETKAKVEVLIHQGEQKVQYGAEVAQQCSAVLEEIVTNVTKVSNLAQEISQASIEQSQGVGEINKAMSELDSVTQNNSIATQSAAKTAESLSTQADSLRHIVEELTHVFNGSKATADISIRKISA